MNQNTHLPNLLADLNVIELSDGRIRVKATGINPETGMIYKELGTVIGKPFTKKFRENAVRNAIKSLEDKYLAVFGDETATEQDMRDAFELVSASVIYDHLRLSPMWHSDSTNKQAVTFFKRNVLPLILPFANSSARMFLPSDRDEIEQTLIADAEQRNGGKYASAVDATHTRLQQADIIYSHMQDRDYRLPDLRLSSNEPHPRAPLPEQLKFLPRSVLSTFYQRLYDLIETDPRLVFFAVFVIFGLRPAEAAARKPSDIVWRETYCCAEVSSQERGGLLDSRLKNEYSRRIIIIPYWGMYILKRCCELIGEDYPSDNHSMNIAVQCAEQVKQILMLAGCSKMILQETVSYCYPIKSFVSLPGAKPWNC